MHRQALFSLTVQIQFQQSLIKVNNLWIQLLTCPAAAPKKLIKSVSRIVFSHHS